MYLVILAKNNEKHKITIPQEFVITSHIVSLVFYNKTTCGEILKTYPI